MVCALFPLFWPPLHAGSVLPCKHSLLLAIQTFLALLSMPFDLQLSLSRAPFSNSSINAQESRCLTWPVVFSRLACSGWGCVCRAATVWGVPGPGEAPHSLSTLHMRLGAASCGCGCSEGPGATSVHRTEGRAGACQGAEKRQAEAQAENRGG